LPAQRPPADPALESSDPEAAASAALHAALSEVLRPLAQLALARGLPFQATEGLLKQAYIEAAAEVHSSVLAHRRVSRISTATGINRREVTRLLQPEAVAVPRPRSLALELFAAWQAHPDTRDDAGHARALPRQGPAPSFEALARSVTRDVHPRSLLDDLLRLGLAALDDDGDTVRLLEVAFVPRGNQAHMLALLGANVGDHLRAAVGNVLGRDPPHFEQAIEADELSAESLAELRALVSRQWRVLTAALVPQLEQMIAADQAAGRTPDQRVRIGLFEFTEADLAVPVAASASAATHTTRKRRSRPDRAKE